jgi:ribosomal protein S18 acetylase RimI-like enzyme
MHNVRMEIRRYQPADRDECYDVCVKSGLAGADASGAYSDDRLIPDIFCGPYLDLEPECAFVVTDGARVVGYTIATADTRGFVARVEAEVLPGFTRRHGSPWPDRGNDGAGADADAAQREMTDLGLHPERMLIPEVDDYPAHLHIDLLPSAQGQGMGRRLIDTLLEELTDRGARGVHLEMDGANTGAGAFYSRLGFTRLASSTSDSVRFGMRLPRA